MSRAHGDFEAADLNAQNRPEACREGRAARRAMQALRPLPELQQTFRRGLDGDFVANTV